MLTRTHERWIAARAIYEETRATVEQLAATTGCKAATIEARAVREKWVRSTESTRPASQNERLAKVVDRLIGEVEAIGMGNGEGGTLLDKARIDAISALTRTLEKIGEITRGSDSAKENQIKRDADMAGILRRIDQRIVELAEGYARQLVRRKPEGPTC
jgi:hypothetical protein